MGNKHKGSTFKGVSSQDDGKAWMARLHVGVKNVCFGTFDSEQAAAKAFDKCAAAGCARWRGGDTCRLAASFATFPGASTCRRATPAAPTAAR